MKAVTNARVPAGSLGISNPYTKHGLEHAQINLGLDTCLFQDLLVHDAVVAENVKAHNLDIGRGQPFMGGTKQRRHPRIQWRRAIRF